VGSLDKQPRKRRAVVPEPHRKSAHPLEHLLSVMNDPSVDPRRRDRAAQAAAPYVHQRITADTLAGKKAAAEAEALVNDKNTEWAKLLRRH
jgi:hypothetical protein